MNIIVAASDGQWEELAGMGSQIEWVRVGDGHAFTENATADAFINLTDPRVLPGYAALNKPVLIDAVTTTLTAMNAPENVLRINGWPGFLQRPVWEIAGKVDDATRIILDKINKKIIIVADEPGFISARIISMIINEAYFAVGENVSSKNEIDTAMRLGTNYPFGPFEWASVIGPENILELLQKLNTTDKCYQPAPLLLKEVASNPS
jgi:3-hydroxybutyryl-CoA dehydrogenase